ncbi:MAG: glycosyltransferase [Synergistaceae bacterium]|jgi:glycosyltransferase involved in cell wall biosynthesis|nr:glycosyltransferase [Synergistaceae bacterium]
MVVPVYNEGEAIKKLFDEVHEKVKVKLRILVVYDFEGDSTVDVVRRISGKYRFPIELVKNDYGRGALNAIKTGIARSSTGAVLVTMADLSDDLSCVDEMYAMVESGYDLVCASRYMRGGRQIGGPLLKKTLSRIAGISLHCLSGIPTHDVTNSFKMYARRVIDNFKIESNGGFELGMELTIKAFIDGYKVGEIPATWRDRAEGTSNFKMWSWIPRYLYWYFFCLKHVWSLQKRRS